MVATDGATLYLRDMVNAMDENVFAKWMDSEYFYADEELIRVARCAVEKQKISARECGEKHFEKNCDRASRIAKDITLALIDQIKLVDC